MRRDEEDLEVAIARKDGNENQISKTDGVKRQKTTGTMRGKKEQKKIILLSLSVFSRVSSSSAASASFL